MMLSMQSGRSDTFAKWRQRIGRRLRGAVGLLLLGGTAVAGIAAERPNILWITCEDISPYLGCYGCPEAQTPKLDRLAREGVRFTHAYANAPVCAVARSTLLTGMYASTIGTHQMRSRMQLPEGIPAYPKLLRQAGYYCTNNRKKDYNSNFENDPTLWDESSAKAHYRNRRPGQPFLAVFNITVTHESQLDAKRIASYVAKKLIPAEPRIDPNAIRLPPYHPDLPAIRRDWARLHDLITLMDSMVGERLRELEEAGLADDTIVFFYSDHGGMLSRSKRYIYNVGTQVPLIVRFPKKWRHWAPAQPGGVVDRLVSFVDFPKTVLSLCGAHVPARMQGRIFLGPHIEPAPGTVHFYRDRMAERYDFSRAVTDGRWYYIRNFMPHRPRGRDSQYGYQVQANWRAWREHYEAGRCNEIQSQFFRPKRVVELFDTAKDPWHVHNLAGGAEHRAIEEKLARDLDAWMVETRDVGLIPEAMFYELEGPDRPHKTLYEYAQVDAYPIAHLLEVAKSASQGDPAQKRRYVEFLRDAHPVARFWGAYGLFRVRLKEAEVQKALQHVASDDPMAANRIMAAQALAVCGQPEEAFTVLRRESFGARDGYAMLLAINAMQYGHVDDRLSRADWEVLDRKAREGGPGDPFGYDYARRLTQQGLALWPERPKVD